MGVGVEGLDAAGVCVGLAGVAVDFRGGGLGVGVSLVAFPFFPMDFLFAA
jgi:hypothetical protein